MKVNILTFRKFSLLFLFIFLSCSEENTVKKQAKEIEIIEVKKDREREVSGLLADKGQPEVQILDLRNSDTAGEFFGLEVPKSNYYFAKRVVMTYSASWRGNPQTESELEDLVWQELLLSFEVFKRGIEPTEEEVAKEIGKTLKAQKVEFDWKKDQEAFKDWADQNLKVSLDVFRNQIKHLVAIQKLKDEIIDSIEPEVTEGDAYQKFLNEYNTLSVELIRIDDLEEAKEFYYMATKPVNDKDLDELIYQDLVLSHEANKREIEVTDDDLAEVIIRFLRDHNVSFKKKDYKKALEEWVKENTKTSVSSFYKHMLDFARLEKLMQQIKAGGHEPLDRNSYDGFRKKNPSISKAYKKFFKEYKADKDRILNFSSFREARSFYKNIDRRPGEWEEEKRKDPKSFKRPGFVALDFLIHMWGFGKDDAYAMLDYDIGSYYNPAPIYKGYGVFKILQIRRAKKSQYEERTEYYFDKVKMIKKHDGYKEWIDKLKEEANIKRYISQ